jgi:hypothetical protein
MLNQIDWCQLEKVMIQLCNQVVYTSGPGSYRIEKVIGACIFKTIIRELICFYKFIVRFNVSLVSD